MQDDSARSLTYVDRQGPDVLELQKQYQVTVRDLDYYFQQCRHSYDDRRNYWPGKSFDLRKNAPDAFPWKGASDQEAHVINEKVNTYISLCLNALNRSHIRAFPVEGGDMARSRVVELATRRY